MNHQYLFFGFFLLLPAFSMAQKIEKGLEFSNAKFGITDESLFDQLMGVVPGVGKSSKELIQRQSVKSYMMPVRDVGNNNMELAYMAAILMEYYVNLDKNYKVNLSPDYIALNMESSGMAMNSTGIMNFLAQDGTVSAAVLPFGSDRLTNAVFATEKFTIKNFLYLFRDVTRGRQRIFETRKALLRGHPVLVEVKSNPAIKTAFGEYYWEPPTDGNNLFPLIIVGYDELEEAFEATSCWGRKWGDNGYIWIHYDDFEKYVVNGYVVIMDY